MNEINEEVTELESIPKELKMVVASISQINSANPWVSKIDEAATKADLDIFQGLVNECRFFYRNEPLVATTINKMIDIGINDLVFSKNGLTDNEFKVFLSLKSKLIEFAEAMALEFLLSGLVVPEVSYGKIKKEDIKDYGIKKYDSLVVPLSMWVRDPKSIKITTSILTDRPIYSVIIPADMIYFITNKGKYPDGKEDKVSFELLKKTYPEFVKLVLAGETEIVLENHNIIRRRYTTDNAYPIPYASASLDALKHKRKFRQMDYSLADKMIGAMLHVKMGSDLFPITDSEEDKKFVDDLRNQLRWRFDSKKDLERIFQLLTSHTVDVTWLLPDTKELLNIEKYSDINLEILYGLGFPRSLITGESAKSGTSDPELSMIGPVKTMENFRRKIIEVIKKICLEVAKENNFKNPPQVTFKQLNLHSFQDLLSGLSKLYETGGLSRQSYDDVLGYDFEDELDKRELEQGMIEKAGIPQVGLSPFSGNNVQEPPSTNQNKKEPVKKDVTNQDETPDTGVKNDTQQE
jgi:hypothetical protein